MAETLGTSTVFTSDSKTVLSLAITCIELMILNTTVGRKNKKSGLRQLRYKHVFRRFKNTIFITLSTYKNNHNYRSQPEVLNDVSNSYQEYIKSFQT